MFVPKRCSNVCGDPDTSPGGNESADIDPVIADAEISAPVILILAPSHNNELDSPITCNRELVPTNDISNLAGYELNSK